VVVSNFGRGVVGDGRGCVQGGIDEELVLRLGGEIRG